MGHARDVVGEVALLAAALARAVGGRPVVVARGGGGGVGCRGVLAVR